MAVTAANKAAWWPHHSLVSCRTGYGSFMMKRTLSVLALIAATFSAPAFAQNDRAACGAMQASLTVRQTETLAMQDKRNALAEQVEAAGEAWENAEAMRAFGSAEAETADATLEKFETLKREFHQTQAALESKVNMINASVARYNSLCASGQAG